MEDWSKKEPRFCYMLLDRLRQDCEYYLRIGGSANCLWADSEKEQIQTMIDIWNSFPDGDKPEWLTMEQTNSIMLDLILRKYSRKYRRFKRQQKKGE